MRRALTGLGCVAALGAALWAGGFAWFVHAATRIAEPPAHADGIVVLTGGAERIEAGLRLLAEGRAERLLISGVGGGTPLPEVLHRAGSDPAPLAGLVTVGRAARSTVGNAVETASWVAAYRVRTLIVVTAGYHMPRALQELARDLPGVRLYAVPVLSPVLREGMQAHVLRTLAGEYNKWLASELGLTRLREDG